MKHGAAPSRFWQCVLERSVPAELRESVSGDLGEVYARVAAERGAAAAARWYRREALSFTFRFALDGVRRGLGRVGGAPRGVVSWLDFKLGMRMLVRYPGLTVIGGLAMAFSIWMGAGAFEIIGQITRPGVPLPDGERIVGIRVWDAAANAPEPHVLHEFVRWREQAKLVQDIGAFRTAGRNLRLDGDVGEPVDVAEISAAGFRVARVRPLLGRTLVDADEVNGAPRVVVIGHDVWQSRFAGDTAVVGRTVHLGAEAHTVVGVMPGGYAFPVSHSVWVPLRVDPLAHEPGAGPSLQMFGKLATGSSMEQAAAEFAALGVRSADVDRQLRPQVVAYPRLIMDVPRAEAAVVMSFNLFLFMLLVLICGNVALLMFARAASRQSELVVRSALGATRGRITGQLFAEALVLGMLAAALGLAATGAGLRWAYGVAEAEAGMRLPFWFSASLSPSTIVYALLLTLTAAAVAGITPALRITRGLQSRLRESAAQGGGVRFSGVWTVVIVCQVAVTVAFPVSTWVVWRDLDRMQSMHVPFATERFLAAKLQADPGGDFGAGGAWPEIEQRLLAEPAVEAVTFADRLPRMYHPHRLVEMDEGETAPLNPQWPGYRISSARVDAAFFDVTGVAIVSGRGFSPADAAPDSRTVVVNESFVRNVMGGRNPIGRRVRYAYMEEWRSPRGEDEPPLPWHEIVGVVPDLGMFWGTHDPKAAGIYHAVRAEDLAAPWLAVAVRGDPSTFSGRLRQVVAAADPSLRLATPQPLNEVNRGEILFMQFWFRLTLVISAVALMLSLAGIYSVMSFTVTRRTREIGIRVALGASPGRLVAGVLRRPMRQVAAGLTTGAALAAALLVAVGTDISLGGVVLLLVYSALLVGVCAAACALPVQRALHIEPSQALASDA